jgi:hypothetical protein
MRAFMNIFEVPHIYIAASVCRFGRFQPQISSPKGTKHAVRQMHKATFLRILMFMQVHNRVHAASRNTVQRQPSESKFCPQLDPYR